MKTKPTFSVETQKPPPSSRWMFTRDTRLESGEHHIDGIDLNGVPIRLCTVETSPGMHVFTDANGPEEETTNDQS